MNIATIIKRSILCPLFGGFYCLQSLFLPARLDELRYDRPVRPRIPTYDRSGQAVHPDILGPDASGRPFVLAFTPYPFSADAFENPSVLISDDGLRFREERKGMNPLVPAPANDHNDDPDLSFIQGSYDLIYLETLRQNLMLLRSPDRVHWTKETIASYPLEGVGAGPFIVSPALAARGNELYLYYVDASAEPYRIEFLKSDDIERWDWKSSRAPGIEEGAPEPWHVDIVQAGGNYCMLMTNLYRDAAHRRRYDLYAAWSSDLESWSGFRKVFAVRPWGVKDIYRSTAYCRGDDIYIYYSYESILGNWGIKVVRKRLGELFPEISGRSGPARGSDALSSRNIPGGSR